MFVNKIVNKLSYFSERRQFKNRNNIAILPKTLKIQNPDFIHVAPDVVFGDNCKLLCTTDFLDREYTPFISIGKNFHATRNLTIQCANSVVIEDNVLIASDVFIIDFNHGNNPLKDSYLDNPLSFKNKDLGGGVLIKQGVWICNSVIILPDVTIGEKSIIAAGAVVTHDIPSYCLAAGNPARVIKKYNFKSGIWEKVY